MIWKEIIKKLRDSEIVLIATKKKYFYKKEYKYVILVLEN